MDVTLIVAEGGVLIVAEQPAVTRMRFDPGFYGTKGWRAFRQNYLRLTPLCAVAGCGQLASHVDHVTARRQGGADYGDVEGLCWSHHSQKTVARGAGFGRAPQAYQPEVKGCDATGAPAEPTHPWNR